MNNFIKFYEEYTMKTLIKTYGKIILAANLFVSGFCVNSWAAPDDSKTLINSPQRVENTLVSKGNETDYQKTQQELGEKLANTTIALLVTSYALESKIPKAIGTNYSPEAAKSEMDNLENAQRFVPALFGALALWASTDLKKYGSVATTGIVGMFVGASSVAFYTMYRGNDLYEHENEIVQELKTSIKTGNKYDKDISDLIAPYAIYFQLDLNLQNKLKTAIKNKMAQALGESYNYKRLDNVLELNFSVIDVISEAKIVASEKVEAAKKVFKLIESNKKLGATISIDEAFSLNIKLAKELSNNLKGMLDSNESLISVNRRDLQNALFALDKQINAAEDFSALNTF